MTSGISVRSASDADHDELIRLQERLRSELGHQKGGPALLATAESPDATVVGTWVGLIGSVPVGLATAGLVVQHDGDLRAVVDLLYVEPEARAVGVGSAMMRSVRQWALEHGAAAIDAMVLPGDRASKNFFERHGLVARAITVRAPLR